MIIRRWVLAGLSFAALPGFVFAEATSDPFGTHLRQHPDGRTAFTLDPSVYEDPDTAALSALPIGVFDSGIGGLTVLEALLTADQFDNDSFKPGADGRPDLQDERFIYLGDQANMPYGNYSAAGKVDYLRELILKDAVFLMGKRYWPDREAEAPVHDKPPVKAIVIACNTATAFGLEPIREALKAWDIPIMVVGVVEAGANGLLKASPDGAVGVLATVGTCASEVYPRTIQSTLGRAGRGIATVTQFGSANLAAIIEGDPAFDIPLVDQVTLDVRGLVDAHRVAIGTSDPLPLRKIMLGCTHFPLAIGEIDAAFAQLRKDPDFAPWIADEREYVNPAEWTARELFQKLAQARLRRSPETPPATERDLFFLSVPNARNADAQITEAGALDHDYKYGRETGRFGIEDTINIPMTREGIPEASRRLVKTKLPAVWERLPAR